MCVCCVQELIFRAFPQRFTPALVVSKLQKPSRTSAFLRCEHQVCILADFQRRRFVYTCSVSSWNLTLGSLSFLQAACTIRWCFDARKELGLSLHALISGAPEHSADSVLLGCTKLTRPLRYKCTSNFLSCLKISATDRRYVTDRVSPLPLLKSRPLVDFDGSVREKKRWQA